MDVGDTIMFQGFNPKPWETIGTIQDIEGQYVRVVWEAKPERPGFLHSSQVKVI